MVEWQIRDEHNGLIYPWLTHPALEEIKTWDLSKEKVLEWGAGASTLWWAHKCERVVSVERNPAYVVHAPNLTTIMFEGMQDDFFSEGEKVREYLLMDTDFDPDIIVVDDILRFECIERALKFPRTKPRKLIIDNWQQDYVFLCPAAEVLVSEFPMRVYEQPGHTEHEGHPWKTAIVFIDADWEVTNDYNSHQRLLKFALDHTLDPVVEFGCGYGSTGALRRYCEKAGRAFYSFETDFLWAHKFKGVECISDYFKVYLPKSVVLFIDSKPGEERKLLLKWFANSCTAIVVHDVQPSADYVYGIREEISRFKYAVEDKGDGVRPWTALVSNFVDVTKWK